VPGSGGLSFSEVQTALIEFASHKNLLGLDIAQYNPDRDPDGSAAQKLIAMLGDVLAARLAALATPAPAAPATPATPAAPATPATEDSSATESSSSVV
jgi:hypothetical protein